MRLRLILRAMYSAKAVYELRKTSILVTILIAIFLGVLQMTPFTIRFFGIEPYRFDLYIWELSASEKQQLVAGLPEDCYIIDATLNCNEKEGFIIGNNISIYFNDPEVKPYNGIVFMDDYFIFTAQGHSYLLSYQSFEGLDFGYLQNIDDGYEVLFNKIAHVLRGLLIMPFVFGSYQTGILTLFIYILGISLLSMLIKFGHTNFISFKEVLNIIVYASIMPIMIVILVGFITPAFSTVIYNMGTPLWAYVVYKKYVIFGLQGSL